MEISKHENDGVVMVSLIGRLDAASAGDTEADLKELAVDKSKILVDLSALEYISSAGLRVLLVLAKIMRQHNAKMCLCALRDSVSEVFDISGFSAIFDIAATEQEALDILKD